MKSISSLSNPQIKEVVRLREHPRPSGGLTLVDGVREISLAIESTATIKEAYYCPEMLKDSQFLSHLRNSAERVDEVSQDVFRKIGYGDRAEGVVAVVAPKVRMLSSFEVGDANLFLVVENVEKPGNLGAILRTADAAGVTGVIVCDQQTWIYNPNVIRASLGTVFTVPVVSCSADEALDFLVKHNVSLFAASPDAKTLYTSGKFDRRTAFVLGAEHAGLNKLWLKQPVTPIRIPMSGRADSLNVSATAAVLVYETLRQRAA